MSTDPPERHSIRFEISPEVLRDQGVSCFDLDAQPEGGKLRIGPGVVTPGAAGALARSGESAIDYVARHARGDWGRFGHFDRTEVTARQLREGPLATSDAAKQNKIAMAQGRGRVMSAYQTGRGENLWVVTTFEHGNETVVLTPDEY